MQPATSTLRLTLSNLVVSFGGRSRRSVRRDATLRSTRRSPLTQPRSTRTLISSLNFSRASLQLSSPRSLPGKS
eukprot:3938006-Rhodomonas_salina.4